MPRAGRGARRRAPHRRRDGQRERRLPQGGARHDDGRRHGRQPRHRRRARSRRQVQDVRAATASRRRRSLRTACSPSGAAPRKACSTSRSSSIRSSRWPGCAPRSSASPGDWVPHLEDGDRRLLRPPAQPLHPDRSAPGTEGPLRRRGHPGLPRESGEPAALPARRHADRARARPRHPHRLQDRRRRRHRQVPGTRRHLSRSSRRTTSRVR